MLEHEEQTGAFRPLTLRDCALQILLPAAVVCFAPVVLVTDSGVWTRILWLYLLACNVVTLSNAVRRWRRVRTGEQILVPTFDALAPTRVPKWLAAPFLCVLTAITISFALALLTTVRSGAPAELVVLLSCILASVVAGNVLAWRRLFATRPRRSVSVTARHTLAELPQRTADIEAPLTAPGHWWTEAGTRNEVREPLRQQVRPGAGHR